MYAYLQKAELLARLRSFAAQQTGKNLEIRRIERRAERNVISLLRAFCFTTKLHPRGDSGEIGFHVGLYLHSQKILARTIRYTFRFY